MKNYSTFEKINVILFGTLAVTMWTLALLSIIKTLF